MGGTRVGLCGFGGCLCYIGDGQDGGEFEGVNESE